jgi:hypothetical protein
MHLARKIICIVALCSFAASAITGCGGGQQNANSGNSNAPPAPRLAAPPPGNLSSNLPHDADFSDNPTTIEQIQHDFDVFSWQSFVALNWPALADGSPDTSKTIGADGDNSTVWESYKESYEVFLPDGSQPLPWGQHQLPAACQGVTGQTAKVLRMTQKVSDEVLDEAGQPFNTGPLVDQQNGKYARYEIRLNQDAFNFIVQNTLYNKQGQEAFTQFIQFPSGIAPSPASPNTPVGAMLIKAAWKVIDPANGDIPGRYHTVQAYVYTPASDNPPTKESCQIVTMGLVGFHIAHKTQSAPQWVWSTFEQVDNVQPGPGLPPGAKLNFFNPACASCPVNTPPPKPWDPNQTLPPEKRSQVKRVIPIDDATKALNAQWQGWLKAVNTNSVWQYYELVSTQWPTNPQAPLTGPNATGAPAPPFLANATLETYIQGKVPNVSSSCIMCHNNATTTNSKFSDFTYLLERAKSKGGGK